MKMFGATKPVTSTQYIQGNKSRTDNADDEGKLTISSIVDLDREVFINIDHKKKEYTEMTFEYYRNMLTELELSQKYNSAFFYESSNSACLVLLYSKERFD